MQLITTNESIVARCRGKFLNNTIQSFLLLTIACGVFLGTGSGFPKAYAAEQAVTNWWPLDGKVLEGNTPFKAVVENKPVEDYLMFWQVGNGTWNIMESNYQDYPHKEAMVDLTNWTWNGRGPYEIHFLATNRYGTIFDQKTINIYTKQSVPTQVLKTVAAISSNTTQSITSALEKNLTIQSLQSKAMSLYVNKNNDANKEIQKNPSLAPLLSKVGNSSTARWFGEWNTSVKKDVTDYVTQAEQSSAVPVLVLYNIPGRDCGNYSNGGAQGESAYRTWVSDVASGIGSRKAIVVVEPDAVALSSCLSESNQTVRYSLLKDAINILKANKNTAVYLDAGHPNWISVEDMSARLLKANLDKADGFALNVSNFETTDANIVYGEAISKNTNGKHFIIDTSRNGRGSNGEWCNPWGRGLGIASTVNTNKSLVDAYLWIKAPGESDGSCNGAPQAGTWWVDYALDLSRNAAF